MLERSYRPGAGSVLALASHATAFTVSAVTDRSVSVYTFLHIHRLTSAAVLPASSNKWLWPEGIKQSVRMPDHISLAHSKCLGHGCRLQLVGLLSDSDIDEIPSLTSAQLDFNLTASFHLGPDAEHSAS